MARSTRIEMDNAKIGNIFAALDAQLKSAYPSIQIENDWTYEDSGLRLMAWKEPTSRMALQLYIQPGKKLPKGMAKLHIFLPGSKPGEDAVHLAKFIEAFQKLHPEAEYGAGGGYARAAPNFLFFVEDMI